MASTFMGIETARRGLTAQQSALYTTGNNIANANTLGYTRQRVDLQQSQSFPSVGQNAPMIPGQMGTGVEAGSVVRVRETFLDTQYRSESSKLGYWENRAAALSDLETIMNEPSDSGLAAAMDSFWESLQDMAVDPQNAGARAVVRQRGIAVAETFNYLHQTVSAEKADAKNELGVSEKAMNTLLSQLDQVNKQIGSVEPNGYLPNDLYDKRDSILDELSQYANIKVSYEASVGNALAQAEGKAVVTLVDDNGNALGTLVDKDGVHQIKVNHNADDTAVDSISIGDTVIDINNFNSTGKLKSVVESYGYKDENGQLAGIYNDMLTELDNLAYTFATEFNKVHEEGLSPNEITDGDQAISFFADSESGSIGEREGFASRITISQDIKNSLDNIVNADPSNPTLGDATYVSKLADIFNNNYDYGNNSEQSNFRNYFEGVIGSMAVSAQEANKMTSNSATLQQTVDNRRMSVSSVSLDEEMSNMIQFQQAYNASARMVTVMDEMLDKIINGMGVGGR
ncbi:flagellar hook-associated protein FlgK [Niallia sp. Sow4_A1]|uniref:flagellar hook-associated protein FlgK n=1 Tax=unclassified Niallia TaxID=2837522 RepID=UPI00203B1FAE|nr:flagellar hook-associated protein FlgK [Niallia sp. MER TA 168]MCM3360946.1 flagellar hook-associated protein FlgK [Niallia sp. MER TA 168]